MKSPNRFTQLKVAFGYILLIALLFFSVAYIYREMQLLTDRHDDETILDQRRHVTNLIISQLYQAEVIGQSLSTGQLEQYPNYQATMRQANLAVDSLRTLLTDSIQLMRLDTVSMLLINKEKNMLNLLKAIQEGGTGKIYKEHIDGLIAQQDSLINLSHVQRKVVTHTNSYTIRKKHKSFLKRLGEVFAPSKEDSTQVNNVVQEEFTDTLSEAYNPADTVATMLKEIQIKMTNTQQERMEAVNKHTQSLRLSGLKLSQQVGQLLGTIEEEEQILAQNRRTQQENIRQNSIRTVAKIAICAVVLATFFLIIIWRDITRSNHYRKELEKAKRRAEDLLVAREKLMLTITHDLKAPIGSILGYTDLLERITHEERQRFYLDNMKSSANHLLRLVSSLLDYHRLDAHKMDVNRVAFNPRRLFDTIYLSFKPMATAKQLELNYECEKSLDGGFISDPFRIRQIVENLLTNALKFTQQGSITLHAALENKQLHFCVSDTGCGISKEEQKRIFKEFTRLHNAQGQEGFGLGLAITHKLVLLLEGEIKTESEPGQGSAFHVFLPLSEETVSATDTTTVCPPADNIPSTQTYSETVTAENPLHLILIDDDRIQLQLTTAMLEHPGIVVTSCEHPDVLFQKLEESRFDVLLTDIQMPAMNGFDLLNKIHSLQSPLAQAMPVIAITARSDMDEKYLRSEGFAGCLHKPFTMNELFTALSQAVQKDIPINISTTSATATAQEKLDFSALTAFSEDDPDAAAEIIRTFISETEKNRDTMEKALARKDMAGITAVAHKMLPLFTMLGATRCVPSLTWLEQKRGTTEITPETTDKVKIVLKETKVVIEAAKAQV